MTVQASGVRLLALLLTAVALSAAGGTQAGERPDLSGLWVPLGGEGSIEWPDEPPYTEWGQARWDAYAGEFDPVVDDPSRFCVPPGMPRSMTRPPTFPIEVIQRPHDITMFLEAWSQYRKIHMEGHDRPPPVLPSRMGYSVGRWEGDTLVIETTHLSERLQGQILMSEQARIEERIRLVANEDGEKRLVNDVVFTDPQTYTEPVVTRGVWAWSPDTPVMEYVCSHEIYELHLQALREQRQAERALTDAE